MHRFLVSADKLSFHSTNHLPVVSMGLILRLHVPSVLMGALLLARAYIPCLPPLRAESRLTGVASSLFCLLLNVWDQMDVHIVQLSEPAALLVSSRNDPAMQLGQGLASPGSTQREASFKRTAPMPTEDRSATSPHTPPTKWNSWPQLMPWRESLSPAHPST